MAKQIPPRVQWRIHLAKRTAHPQHRGRQLHDWRRGSLWRQMLHVQVYSSPFGRNAHIPLRGSKLCSGYTRLHILSRQGQHTRGKVRQHGSSVYIHIWTWPRRDLPGLRPCHMVAHGRHGYYHSVHTHSWDSDGDRGHTQQGVSIRHPSCQGTGYDSRKRVHSGSSEG